MKNSTQRATRWSQIATPGVDAEATRSRTTSRLLPQNEQHFATWSTSERPLSERDPSIEVRIEARSQPSFANAGACLGSVPWLPSTLAPGVAELARLPRVCAADDAVSDQPGRLVRGAVEVR